MSTEDPNAENTNVTPAASMAAFAKNIDEIKHALDILYIPNNASGRNKFREKWPDFADYIFGEELIKCDNEGTKDRDYRSNLEDTACQRRLLLKHTISEMVDKSVDGGVIQFDYVGQVIDNFGPKLSVLLYAADVVKRVRPDVFSETGLTAAPVDLDGEAVDSGAIEDVSVPAPPNVEMSAAEDTSVGKEDVRSSRADDSTVTDHKLSEDEVALLSNKPDDDFDINSYDHVSPIVTDGSVEGAEGAEGDGGVSDPQGDAAATEEANPAPQVEAPVPAAAVEESNPAPLAEPTKDVQSETDVEPAPETAAPQDNPAPPIDEPNPAPPVSEPASSNSEELLADLPEPIVRPRAKEGAEQNFSVPSSNHVPSMDGVDVVTKDVEPEKSVEDIVEEAAEPVQGENPAPPIEKAVVPEPNPAPPIDEPNPAPSVEKAQSNPAPPVAEPNPAPPINNPAPDVAEEPSNPAPPIADVQGSNPAPPIDKTEGAGAAASPLNLHKVKKVKTSEPSLGQGNIVSDDTDKKS